MYNTTEQCQVALSKSSRQFSAYFVPENETTEYREIKSIKISAISAADGQITIGDTSSKTIQIMAIVDSMLVEGQKISVYESVKLDDGTYQDIPMGKYTITSLTEKGGITTIEGAGPLSVATYTPYFSKLTYPSDTISMLKEISTMIGVQINYDNLAPITFEKKPEGYICREIIGYIAALHGRNAVEERDGSISLKWYENQNIDIFSDRTELPEIKKSDFVVNKLQCIVSTDITYTKGSGTGIVISNPFMTEAIMENIWKQIQGYSYRPAEINVKSGNPCIDQWDSYSYGIYNIICAKIDHKYDGGVQNTITSSGESETESNTGFKGPTTIAMERYAAEIVLVNEALVHKLTADEADIKYIKASELTTVEANIKNAVIGSLSTEFATVKYLETNYAQINLANVEKATIGTVLADVGLITNATIVDGHVTGYLDSVNINANSITAGDLSVERLIIRGSEKSLVYALNNITGALQAQNVDTINGEVLTQRTVTADRLVAKSITANEIATKTITAASGIIADAAITTANIADLAVTSAKISSLDAAKITTGTLDAARIAASSITSDKLSIGGGGNLYATGYDTFENIPNTSTRIYYGKSSVATVRIDTSTAYYGNRCLRIDLSGADGYVYLGDVANGYGCIPVIAGKTYIVSAWMKASAPTTAQLYVVGHTTKNSTNSTHNGTTATIGTSWTRVYLRYTAVTTYPYISIRIDNDTNGATLWVDAIQIETGTATQTPSEFTPAGTTIIDGARIATGTVTADSIAANAITADKLNVSSLSAITANLGTVTAGTINMKNVNGTTPYITYTDTGGYYNQIGSYGMTLFAERNSTSVSAGFINMQLNDSESAITMTRYATDYATDIAPGWAIFSHRISVGGYNNTSYALSASSFICNSWIRTVGSTGWYNETYGGGWYMSDTTWLRAHNNKSIYTEGTIQGNVVKTRSGANLDTINSNYSVKYIKKTYSNVSGWTTGTVNYKVLDTFAALGVPSGKKVVSINIIGWSGAPGMFNVIQNSAGTAPVLMCTGTGTFTSVTIQIAYQ